MNEHMSDKIGDLVSPKSYFKGEMTMWYGSLGRNLDVAYFSGYGGEEENTLLAMCGSAQHFIGNVDKVPGPNKDLPPIYGGSYASDLNIFRHLLREVEKFDKSLNDNDLLKNLLLEPEYKELDQFRMGSTISRLNRGFIRDKAPKQRVEFLAKTLLVEDWGQGRRLILGTPLYVALLD